MSSIHQYSVEGIGGEEIELSQYKGKKMLVVNVASECGFTPQYQQLQELYEEFQDKLTVLGIPSNDFGGQEPGTNKDIQAFCTDRFGVSFPMAAKVSIRNNPHPVYQWLQQKQLNGRMDTKVKWNFHKYLLDEDGQLVQSLSSSTSPFDDAILNWIGS